MCGIVAAVARENIVDVLIEGLKKLEYRGYDSAGMAVAAGQAPRHVRQEMGRRRIALRAAEGSRFEVTCLFAQEMLALGGVKPVDWRLLTNRQAVYRLGKISSPKTMPGVREVIRQIVRIGAFLRRECDSEPNVKSLWIGVQRIRDFIRRYRICEENSWAMICVESYASRFICRAGAEIFCI